MPYTIGKSGNQYCVYKQNEDGTQGDLVANTCHAKKQDAIDQMVAIEYSEKIYEKAYDVIMAEQQYSLSIVAEAFIWARRLEEAVQVIDQIQDKVRQARLYALAGYMAAKDGNSEIALEYFNKAQTLIATLESDADRGYSYSTLVSYMRDAGFLDEARTVAETMKTISDASYRSIITFKQDDQGDWWFIGLYSNKFMDRDEEILSEESHQKYVEWVKESGVRPPVVLMHMPRHVPGFWLQVMKAHDLEMISTETLNSLLKDFYKDYALGMSEKIFYANGFTGVVAKVYNDKVGWVNNLINYHEDIGMSHGFVPIEMDGNIYKNYRSFEFSILPRRRAANTYTSISLMEDTSMAVDKDTQEFLDGIREGTAEEIDAQTQKMSADLEEAGVAFKEADLIAEIVKKMKWDEFVDLIKARFDEYHAVVAEFNDRMEALESRVKQVEKSEDEKIAEKITPNYAQQLKGPSDSPDNVTDVEPAQQVFDFLTKAMS